MKQMKNKKGGEIIACLIKHANKQIPFLFFDKSSESNYDFVDFEALVERVNKIYELPIEMTDEKTVKEVKKSLKETDEKLQNQKLKIKVKKNYCDREKSCPTI